LHIGVRKVGDAVTLEVVPDHYFRYDMSVSGKRVTEEIVTLFVVLFEVYDVVSHCLVSFSV